jgi:predicted dienelactone hydrolase
MRPLKLCFAAAISMLASLTIPAPASSQPFTVGLSKRDAVPATERHWRGARVHALASQIWYPAEAGAPAAPREIGPPGRPFFIGLPVARDATISSVQATFPMIVISPGTGGTGDNLDWVAAPLASAGYIVVAVDHPGTNATNPMTWDGLTLWWERAVDLSNVIDAILSDPVIGPRVDAGRIGALGFSLGGHTVLELAGARTDLAAFHAFCVGHPGDAVCEPPEMARISDARLPLEQRSAESKASLARAGASYRDPRVKAVFALAPALGQALTLASLSAITIPIGLLAGERDLNVPIATNLGRIETAIPSASVTRIAQAAHYTFIALCQPAMAAVIPSICRDPEGIDRAAVHGTASGVVRAFFDKNLR